MKSEKCVTTRIVYDGCNSLIAASLCKGKKIKCRVADFKENLNSTSEVVWIIAYVNVSTLPKYLDEDLVLWRYARPITMKKYIKDPVSIMKYLIEKGFKCNEYGNWIAKWNPAFSTGMWRYCGTEIDNDANSYTWNPEWLEEREE